MNCICQYCSSPFTGNFKTRFCSDECRQQYKRGYEKAWRASHKKVPPPKPEYEPFPSDIDRDSFGHWLSGFVDGEGTFQLRAGRQNDRSEPRIVHFAHFRITLRDDDADVLRLIQSYWACGMVYFASNVRSKTKANPIAVYSVQSTPDLAGTVVAHFERFPLRSKKRNDFIIWKQAIELMSHIQSRPIIGRLGLSGIMPKWTDEDREKFRSLSESLKDQRIYK
jgi:hypothetical protein